MKNKMDVLKNDGIIIENYKDVETNQNYNLLIFKCFVNDIDCSFVIGSIERNIKNVNIITEYINKIISFRFNNKGDCFIYSVLNSAYKNGIFDDINLSKFAYDILIACKSYQYFKEKFIFNPKEIILDSTSKRFATISNTDKPFNPLDYYMALDEQKNLNDTENQKQLKKVI